jgi:hypothetical protein
MKRRLNRFFKITAKKEIHVGRSDQQEVMMIGIDAGGIDYIQASLDRLPNLRRLFSDGGFIEATFARGHHDGIGMADLLHRNDRNLLFGA